MVNKRILIVDDDTGICRLVQIALKAIAGWEVLIAESGAEGLAIAQTEYLDAILLDVMMPEIDGITTLKLMQKNPAIKSIPIILLTAKAQISEQKQFVDLAIAGVILKPFKAPDLVKQMRSILNWTE